MSSTAPKMIRQGSAQSMASSTAGGGPSASAAAAARHRVSMSATFKQVSACQLLHHDPVWRWEAMDKVLAENGERFIMRSVLPETVMGTHGMIVLSDGSWYKIEEDTCVPRKRKQFLAIHSVVEDDRDDKAFYLYTYKNTKKLKSLQAVAMISGSGAMLDFSAFLQTRHFVCRSAQERFQWVFMFDLLLRRKFQSVLETTIVPAPEVYQHHACVVKLNRKGKAQDRLLVVTDSWVYNVEMNRDNENTKVQSLKWAFPIISMKAVSLTRTQGDTNVGPAIRLYFDKQIVKSVMKTPEGKKHKGSKSKDFNDTHLFAFRSQQQRQVMVAEMARLYFALQNPVDDLKQDHEEGKEPIRLLVDSKEDVVVQERQRRRSMLPRDSSGGHVRRGYLTKFIHGGKGQHQKYVCIFPSGLMEYSDGPNKGKKKQSRIISVNTNTQELKHKKLTSDVARLLFTVQTTDKTIHFLAKSVQEREDWVVCIEQALGLDGESNVSGARRLRRSTYSQDDPMAHPERTRSSRALTASSIAEDSTHIRNHSNAQDVAASGAPSVEIGEVWIPGDAEFGREPSAALSRPPPRSGMFASSVSGPGRSSKLQSVSEESSGGGSSNNKNNNNNNLAAPPPPTDISSSSEDDDDHGAPPPPPPSERERMPSEAPPPPPKEDAPPPPPQAITVVPPHAESSDSETDSSSEDESLPIPPPPPPSS